MKAIREDKQRIAAVCISQRVECSSRLLLSFVLVQYGHC